MTDHFEGSTKAANGSGGGAGGAGNERPVRVAVIHYSATGNVRAMAQALAEGARSAGAQTRVLGVQELAPAEAIAANRRWSAHREAVRDQPLATLDDLVWADGLAFGSPTRFGGPAAQLKQFLDQTGGLWAQGALADKVATSFTSASTQHGGLESTILAINNILYHWGTIVMPLGYTAEVVRKQTGNPYGASWVSRSSAAPDDEALAAARHQGARLASVAAALSLEARRA
ncbi:MAG TPA: NAD(P)H:quinone oxidoreductase [Conexibacter sp.]|jgi:NAD(P)H dehydrogenase (quinone)